MRTMSPKRNHYVWIALALAAPAIVLASCRPRTEESGVKAESDIDASKGQVSIEKVGTGDTFAVRYRHDDRLKDGQTIYVKWGVKSNYSDTDVDCAKIPGQAQAVTHKVEKNEGSLKLGGFDLEVPAATFKKCTDADPEGHRKISLKCMESGDWNGPKRLEGCVYSDAGATQLVGKGWGLPREDQVVVEGFGLDETIPDENKVINYGKICAQRLGSLPAFDCRAGEIMKITVNGTETPFGQHKKDMKCDKPVYLGLGSDGQCVPYARLGRLKTSNPDVDTVYICRRYKIFDNVNQPRPADKAWHEDVAVVQHNRVTGETCWFQALSGMQPGERPLATHRVPPPDEEALPADVVAANAAKPAFEKAMKATDFWIKPDDSRNFACIRCHDSDPYMLSPYSAQVTVTANGVKDYLLPCDPAKPGQTQRTLCKSGGQGKYSNVSARHNPPHWPSTFAIAPKDPTKKECVSCHRIGSINTCRSWARDSVGIQNQVPAKSQAQKSDRAKKFPDSHWMPVAPGVAGHGYATVAAWQAAMKSSADAQLECCTLHAGLPGTQAQFNAKCEMTPISTPPPTGGGGGGASVTIKTGAETDIPDNNTEGVLVALAGATLPAKAVKSLEAKVNVRHPYIGHVKIELIKDGQTVTIYDGAASEIPADANLNQTFKSTGEGAPLAAFVGQQATGTWQVKVSDGAPHEKGKLVSFELTLTVGE